MKNLKWIQQSLTLGNSVVKWWRVLEHPRLGRSLLKRVILLIQGRFSKELCISAYLFLRTVYQIGRKSGWHFCALYLKQSAVSLKLAYGGQFEASVKQSVPVSLNGSGYPRIIPRFHRHQIQKKDDRADYLVRFYLSMFSFYTIIEKPKALNKKVFQSIVQPVSNIDEVKRWVGELKISLPSLISRYLPDVSSIPLQQGMVWTPSGKTLPTYRAIRACYGKGGLFQDKEKYLKKLSPLMVQTFELAAFRHLVEFVNARGEQWNQGALFAHYVRHALDPYNKILSGQSLDFFETRIGPYLPKWAPELGPVMTGCLGQKVEGGGKRRIFAMGNWVNQQLLTPVHNWLAQVLRSIPMDGTFDQHAPLKLLVGSKDCHSLDLSSATDRWPLLIMFETLCALFDRSFASSVVNSALATNLFFVPFLKRKKREGYNRMVGSKDRWVSFVAGQPLGYRSSWPLFALTHHILVWWCANQVHPDCRVFRGYAVLGDDIVITDTQVALLYRDTIHRLGVGISEAKSLVSTTGALEFASRFLVKSASKDLSPITVKSVLGAHLPLNRMALCHIHPLKFSTFRRLGGRGHRVLRASPRPLVWDKQPITSEWRDYMLWLKHRCISLSWYLGTGNFLRPDQFWSVYSELVRRKRPSPLKKFDGECLVSSNQLWFLEKTQMRTTVDKYYNVSYKAWFSHYKMAEGGDSSGLDMHGRRGWDGLLEEVFHLPDPVSWVLKRGASRVLFSYTVLLKIWEWLWRTQGPVLCLPSVLRVFIVSDTTIYELSEPAYWGFRMYFCWNLHSDLDKMRDHLGLNLIPLDVMERRQHEWDRGYDNQIINKKLPCGRLCECIMCRTFGRN